MNPGSLAVPMVVCAIVLYGLFQGVDVFACFLEGAREGLETAVSVLPALVALMTCIGMFRASGAMDILAHLFYPLYTALGIPPEVIPLAVLRPVSGGGGLLIFSSLLEQFGPDSFVGRVAAVMQSSSETTFYIIAVYYGSAGVSHIRHTLPASLAADAAAVIMSVLMVRLLF